MNHQIGRLRDLIDRYDQINNIGQSPELEQVRKQIRAMDRGDESTARILIVDGNKRYRSLRDKEESLMDRERDEQDRKRFQIRREIEDVVNSLNSAELSFEEKLEVAGLLRKIKGWGYVIDTHIYNQIISSTPSQERHKMMLADFLTDLSDVDNLKRLFSEELEEPTANVEVMQRVTTVYLSRYEGFAKAADFLVNQAKAHPQDKTRLRYAQSCLIERGLSGGGHRNDAIKHLKQNDFPQVITRLGEVFRDTSEDDHRRTQALHALVEINHTQAMPYVREGLSDKNSAVRLQAAREIRQYGSSGDVERLANMLNTEGNSEVRQAIMNALGRLDNKPRTLWEKILGRRPWAKT